MALVWLVCALVLSFALTRRGLLRSQHTGWANRYIINVALPAVALLNLPALPRNAQAGYAVISPLVVFAGAYLLFYVLLKKRYTPSQRVVPTVLSGLGNTSFIGFPLIAVLWGTQHMGYAVVYDQVGFILMATAAQFLISQDEGNPSVRGMAQRVLFFPPFLAMLVGLALLLGGYESPLQPVLKLASQSLSPMAMVVVGFTLARHASFRFPTVLRIGLSYKLLVAPAAVYLVLQCSGAGEAVRNMSVFEAAMGPMITPAILLLHHKKDPRLVAQFLFWGIALSFASTPLWFLLLR